MVSSDLDWPSTLATFLAIQSPGTRRQYGTSLRLFRDFSPVNWGEVAPAHVAAWRDWRQKAGVEHSTIRGNLAAVRAFYDYAAKRGLRPAYGSNPVADVERPRVQRYAGARALTDEQVHAILAQPDLASLRGKRDYAILATLLFTAVRREEVTSLRYGTLGDLTLTQHRLPYHRKGQQQDWCLIDVPELIDILRDYVAVSGHVAGPDSYLFVSLRGNRKLTGNAVYKIVERYADAAGVAAHPHQFRHTAARWLRADGVATEAIQRFLKHARLATTEEYLDRVTVQGSGLGSVIGRRLRQEK